MAIAEALHRVEKTPVDQVSGWKKPETVGDLDFLAETVIPSLIQGRNGNLKNVPRLEELQQRISHAVVQSRQTGKSSEEPLDPSVKRAAISALVLLDSFEPESLGDCVLARTSQVGNFIRGKIIGLSRRN